MSNLPTRTSRGHLRRKSNGDVSARKQMLHNEDYALVDVSGSMGERAFSGKSKMDCVREAMAPLDGRVQVIAFSDITYEASCTNIPGPFFGTNLSKAMDLVDTLEPLHVLVVSDGYPIAPDYCIAKAAEAVNRDADKAYVIDVLYIGPMDDQRGIEFMKKLAEAGHGRYCAFDIANSSPKMLETKVSSMLSLPAPETITL